MSCCGRACAAICGARGCMVLGPLHSPLDGVDQEARSIDGATMLVTEPTRTARSML